MGESGEPCGTPPLGEPEAWPAGTETVTVRWCSQEASQRRSPGSQPCNRMREEPSVGDAIEGAFHVLQEQGGVFADARDEADH